MAKVGKSKINPYEVANPSTKPKFSLLHPNAMKMVYRFPLLVPLSIELGRIELE